MSSKSLNKTTILSILYCLFINGFIWSQNVNYSKKDIETIIDKSVDLLYENNFESSLLLAKKALYISIKKKDSSLISESYNTIGVNFDRMLLEKKALFYYKKALKYANKTKDFSLKSMICNNLGNIYFTHEKKYKLGMDYFFKSLYYCEIVNNNQKIYFRKLNICWSYFSINQFKKAKPFWLYINKFEKYGDENTIVILNMLNGIYYNYINDFKKAEFYFSKAILIGKKSYEKQDLCDTYKYYSDFLAKTNQYKKAFIFLNLHHKLNQEILNGINVQKGKITGLNIELNEYLSEVEKIESEYLKKQEILLNDKKETRRVFFGVVALFAISIIIFYFYIQNTRLIQKNRINKLNSTIQENIINATISGQEIERKKIAAFLHDNISALLSSAGLHLKVFTTKNKETSEEINKTIALLSEAHDGVRDLSHELIPALLVRFGLLFALEDLCDKYSNSDIQFDFESAIDTNKRYSEEFELKTYFIVSELLNNIIKHSNASLAKISLQENSNVLVIQINDNGKGFQTDILGFFDGFGINQIRARINAMNGFLKIDSKIDIGTIITLNIPVI